MKKVGRKLIPINWEDFEKLCSLHCTQQEIAEWFNCSPDTIDRAVKRNYGEGFAEIFKKKSSKGKISLRRKMFEAALGGNITMMIWLSKQHLGMSDKQEVKNDIIQPIKVEPMTASELKTIIKKDPFIKMD